VLNHVSNAVLKANGLGPTVNSRPQLDLSNFLPYLVNRVGSAFVAHFTSRALEPHDLSIAMWRVLAALSHDGEQRLIDLAGMTSIDVSTLSRLVTRLVHAGLVSRTRSKTSNREILIRLTARGRALVDRLIPIARELEARASSGIPSKDVAVVKRSLRRIFENMAAPATVGRRRARRAAR
jgi:DNA-binding MarR family transcriptional regulator